MLITSSSFIISNSFINADSISVNLTIREFSLVIVDKILSDSMYIYDVAEFGLISGDS